jgi:transketolase
MNPINLPELENLAKIVRKNILTSTTTAGSGHPTSSLSATDLMTVLMFAGFFRANLEDPNQINNDRLIFSKGHAAPLLYALYAVAGKIDQQELQTLRKFGSRLEGHPTMNFEYTEAATGSLGQGLGVGLGMSLKAKMDSLDYRTFVLLGDSELAEGSVWEAMQLASFYQANNLIGILDVNRLGQRGETMQGYDLENYRKKVEAFGWQAILLDGHNLQEIYKAFETAVTSTHQPSMLIAKTLKGKGVEFLEDQDGFHGKAVSPQMLSKALAEIGQTKEVVGKVALPSSQPAQSSPALETIPAKEYQLGDMIATRGAYGQALLETANPEVVVLDAETSNSTHAEDFKKVYPDRFLEMFITEQNMVSTALGLARRGKIPFVSTFSAFFSRAFDQIRMSQYSAPNIKLVGSHCGCSIGEDGSSQMGLEDLGMMRTIQNMVIMYPADAVSTQKIVSLASQNQGNFYIRTTRAQTQVIYTKEQEFEIGGSHTVHQSKEDQITIVGAGITLQESLKAFDKLTKEGVKVRIIDLYCIKPVDKPTLQKAGLETGKILVVEDHYPEGGIFSAVAEALAQDKVEIFSLAVTKMPRSGTPAQLLEHQQIDSQGIYQKAKQILAKS